MKSLGRASREFKRLYEDKKIKVDYTVMEEFVDSYKMNHFSQRHTMNSSSV